VGGHVTFVRDLVTFVGPHVPLECLDENLPDFSLSVVLGRLAEISPASRASNADSLIGQICLWSASLSRCSAGRGGSTLGLFELWTLVMINPFPAARHSQLNRPGSSSSSESGCGGESRLFGPWVQAGVPGDTRCSGDRVDFDAAGLVAAVGVGDAGQDQGELFPVEG